MKRFANPGARSKVRHPFPERHTFDTKIMRDVVEPYWRLNRSAVNEDTDKLASFLAETLNAEVFEAQAGETCLTWKVPLNWKVRKAQLRRTNGEVIVDYADNPLHLWTHSTSFQGVVEQEALFAQHVSTDHKRPDEFSYHYRNGYQFGVRDWGFSVPYSIIEGMKDEAYEVDIDADLDENGTLKVVDASLPGELPDTIFIMAHTCHPALVSDGIGCIGVASALYRWLEARPRRRYTYRFIFSPEYFGAAVYLAKAPRERIEDLRYGMYLDMLTTHEPLGFQTSLQGNSLVDRVTRNVIRSHVTHPFERTFRKSWGNDELLYNGPGFEIPTVGIGRAMHREYHYNTDDLDRYSDYTALESLWVLSRIVEVMETDYVPVRRFEGPVYRSQYGIDVDMLGVPAAAHVADRIQVLMDGERSWFDIAEEEGLDGFVVREFIDQLLTADLIERKPRERQPSDAGSLTGGQTVSTT